MNNQKREHLTKEKLKELINQLKQGNQISRNTLINYFMPTAQKIASEYYGLGLENEDIISSAFEGLVLGINKLEKSENENIYNKIYHSIRRTIEINIATFYGIYFNEKEERYTPLAEKIVNILKAQKHLRQTLHHNPSLEEISNYTGLNKDKVIEVLSVINYKKSLEYEELQTLKNELLNLEDQIIEKEIINEFYTQIKRVLNEQQLKVFYLQYKEKLSVRKIAEILNVTHARVGKIEEKIKIIVEEIIASIKSEEYIKIKNLELQRKTIKEIMELASSKDVDAFNYLYNHYLPIAKKIASEYYDVELPKEIILSFAYKGLTKGLSTILDTTDSDIHRKLARFITKEIKENIEKCGIDLKESSKTKKLTK